jgi:hypothetical protein
MAAKRCDSLRRQETRQEGCILFLLAPLACLPRPALRVIATCLPPHEYLRVQAIGNGKECRRNKHWLVYSRRGVETCDPESSCAPATKSKATLCNYGARLSAKTQLSSSLSPSPRLAMVSAPTSPRIRSGAGPRFHVSGACSSSTSVFVWFGTPETQGPFHTRSFAVSWPGPGQRSLCDVRRMARVMGSVPERHLQRDFIVRYCVHGFFTLTLSP